MKNVGEKPLGVASDRNGIPGSYYHYRLALFDESGEPVPYSQKEVRKIEPPKADQRPGGSEQGPVLAPGEHLTEGLSVDESFAIDHEGTYMLVAVRRYGMFDPRFLISNALKINIVK